MVTSFINIISSIIAYLAAKGIDHLLSKWVAYAMITWEKSASKKARDQYRSSMNAIVEDLADKYDDWKKWKDSLKPKP